MTELAYLRSPFHFPLLILAGSVVNTDASSRAIIEDLVYDQVAWAELPEVLVVRDNH